MQPSNIQAVSEDTLLLSWEPADSGDAAPALVSMLGEFASYLLTSHSEVIINVVPAYHTLLVQYDVLRIEQDQLQRILSDWLSPRTVRQTGRNTETPIHVIPVFYDTRVAPDLESISQSKGISVNAVIELHTARLYTVYAVGFQPGFAYLGYVDKAIATPRLSTFRSNVPAGSVGIADRQTAVYPAASPGGWQIIGRSPQGMLSDNKSLLSTGDRVQFEAINEARFLELGGSVERFDG